MLHGVVHGTFYNNQVAEFPVSLEEALGSLPPDYLGVLAEKAW